MARQMSKKENIIHMFSVGRSRDREQQGFRDYQSNREELLSQHTFSFCVALENLKGIHYNLKTILLQLICTHSGRRFWLSLRHALAFPIV